VTVPVAEFARIPLQEPTSELRNGHLACKLRALSAIYSLRSAMARREAMRMAWMLHVGNLVWEASADDLYRLFQGHGQVLHAQVIMDWDRGQSRGFGFVEMADEVDALQAIRALHGQPYRGRPLTVAEAHRGENPVNSGEAGLRAPGGRHGA